MLLARFTTLGEAGAARSALVAAGLVCRSTDENVVGVNWFYSNAIGGVKIHVLDADYEEADRILREEAGEAPVDAEASQEEIPTPEPVLTRSRCPSCGSANVTRIPRLKLFAVLTALIIGIGAAVNQPGLAAAAILAAGLTLAFVASHRCQTCGERWSEAAAEPVDEFDAPPPALADTFGLSCPRCGEPDVHFIRYRRLKALPLLFSTTIVIVLPVWLLLPKKRCDHCGKRLWL